MHHDLFVAYMEFLVEITLGSFAPLPLYRAVPGVFSLEKETHGAAILGGKTINIQVQPLLLKLHMR